MILATQLLAPVENHNENQKKAIFYIERALEQLEHGCIALAKRTYENYKSSFHELLNVDHCSHIEERLAIPDDWTVGKEQAFFEKIQHAASFSEHKMVHDLAHEILLHHQHPAESCKTHDICDPALAILAHNNMDYLEPDEVAVNTIIDAPVEFIVEQRRARNNGNEPLQGNPGFYLKDALGNKYRCFIKQVNQAKIGDELNLKITNLPGLSIAGKNSAEPIVYLEPRAIPGETIEITLLNLSHTGNSFTFRHHSYDGFLWFKRRGVNKEIFNQHTLRPGDKILAKVLYTSEDIKFSRKGTATRLGVVKVIPLRRVEDSQSPEQHRSNGVAKVQG